MSNIATARALYSDLVVLTFAIGASSLPTQTQVGNLITGLYIEAYEVANGVGTYATYDAAAEDPIIDTPECKQLIINEATGIVNAWHIASVDNPPPDPYLSPKAVTKLKNMRKRSTKRLSNVRVYGEERDDY